MGSMGSNEEVVVKAGRDHRTWPDRAFSRRGPYQYFLYFENNPITA